MPGAKKSDNELADLGHYDHVTDNREQETDCPLPALSAPIMSGKEHS